MSKEVGVVKHYNAERGFGFIARGNGPDAFFHISQVTEAIGMTKGCKVEYTLEKNDKGYIANDITIIEQER